MLSYFNLSLLLVSTWLLMLANESSALGSYRQECTQDGPLGMISGDIRDWQITASSTFPATWAKGCEERHGRLYRPNGYSWCAQYKGTSEWLQVDLGVEATVTGVMTQGRGDSKEWVTAYMVAHSQDANKWTYIMDQYGNQRVFEGNTDSFSTKHNYLEMPIVTRFVRLHPIKYSAHPSMRMEIIGCQPCKQLLAVPPYERLSASSSRGRRSMRTCDPSYGHVLSDKAWCAKKQDTNQWLQLDLGPPAWVTGLITKGRGDGKKEFWVKAYRVAYSNDGNMWTFYKDAAHLSPKEEWNFYLSEQGTIFGGNYDRNTERVHYLNKPFEARYVRFHPVTWQRRIAMRAGVYGCPHRGDCGPGFFRVNNATRCQANLAFGKSAWLNGGDPTSGGGKHRKRHLGARANWHHGAAPKAVDGVVTKQSCAVLSNADIAVPSWFVDLKARQGVQGVLVYTGLNDTSISATLARQLNNLDRLEVYVAKKPRHMNNRKRTLLCGVVTNLNKALQQPRIHVACSRPMQGRYVYLEAKGSAAAPIGWGGQFSTTLCEVVIY